MKKSRFFVSTCLVVVLLMTSICAFDMTEPTVHDFDGSKIIDSSEIVQVNFVPSGEVLGTSENITGNLLPDEPVIVPYGISNLLFSMNAENVTDMLPSSVGGKYFNKTSFENAHYKYNGTLTDSAADAATIKCGVGYYDQSSDSYIAWTSDYFTSGVYGRSLVYDVSALYSNLSYVGYIKKTSSGAGSVRGQLNFFDVE